MVSDYERIRDDNIKEYGEGTRHLAFLGRLYTDRTHFVFELLQNAEDAGATRVRFRLYANRLEVWHDGKLFDEKDVRGISGVGEGTKAEDLTQIGKFGIGFKSVYAYTSRPEVHCGDEHFCIENYVRPQKVSGRSVSKPWTTLFSFPFKHPDIEPEIAYREIGKRLQALSPRTLLFLHNITEISWDTVKGLSGVYSREMSSCGPARKVVITSRDNLQNEEEAWIIFSRQLDVPKESGEVKVEVAFNVIKGKEEERDEIAPIVESPLVVFFPTEKATHLGFLIQGPYRTTPSRDNIPKDDPWNKYLVEETGRLTVDSLVQLREMRLLTVSLLQALPINTDKFSVDGMFRPIYDYVRDALRNQPLLPAHNGNVTKAENAKLAITNDLRELLADEQLSVLYHHTDSLAWLSGNITIGKTPVLRNFLMRELGVEEVSWETFARKFDSTFIELQSDAWIAKLYGILDGHKALWRAADSKFSNRRGVLRNKPFIRLEDGSHVPPFDSNGTPGVYIGPLEETDFPVVKRNIAGDIQAQEFLKHLGLSEPDLVAEVIDNILPEYENGMADVKKPMQRHAANLQKILKAFQTDSRAKREILIKRLKETSFLLAINAGNSQKKFKRPEEIYFRKKELEEFFDGYPEVWFLDESEGISVWADLGVENWPRRISKVPALSWKEKTEIRDGDGCTREIAVIDYDLHGLVHYLESLKNRDTSVLRNSSMILWNFLLAYHEGISSHQYEEFFRGKYEWFYFHKKSAHFESSFLKSLRSNKWLPSENGGVHSPGSLRLADLPDGFKKDEALSRILMMKSTEFEALASKLEFDPAFLELVRENEDKVKQFLKKQHEQVQNYVDINTQLDDEGYESDINYDKEFENAFNQKSRGIELSQREPARGIVDPDRRREKVGGQIKDEQRAEPSIVSRFKRVSRKVWERKDNRVRNFLTEEYNGKCQICDESFLKINGAPYFEGLYLVPRIHARWVARPGNVLCLCPTCCAKFQYGPVVADDILTQIMSIRTAAEGAIEKPYLTIELCGRREQIRFTESHLLELQGLLRASQGER